MSKDNIIEILSRYGSLVVKDIDYITFRGSRNLNNRSKHTTEYLFILKKGIDCGQIKDMTQENQPGCF